VVGKKKPKEKNLVNRQKKTTRRQENSIHSERTSDDGTATRLTRGAGEKEGQDRDVGGRAGVTREYP